MHEFRNTRIYNLAFGANIIYGYRLAMNFLLWLILKSYPQKCVSERRKFLRQSWWKLQFYVSDHKQNFIPWPFAEVEPHITDDNCFGILCYFFYFSCLLLQFYYLQYALGAIYLYICCLAEINDLVSKNFLLYNQISS